MITGQQCGLGGGPLFTLTKAAACTLWAEELTRRGRRAAPLFWMASEDHDFAEVARAYFPPAGPEALTLGEEAAAGVGVDLPRTRRLVVVGAGLATGAAVAIAGAIGFVGIVAPHLVRPLVNHDPARTLAPSALLAGLILVVADIGVRVTPTDTELKLGVVAALLGAPVFVWIAARRRVPGG